LLNLKLTALSLAVLRAPRVAAKPQE